MYAYALTSKEKFSIEYTVHQHNKMRTHNWPNLNTLITQKQDFFYKPLIRSVHFEYFLYVGYHDLMVVGKPIKKIHVKPTPKPYIVDKQIWLLKPSTSQGISHSKWICSELLDTKVLGLPQIPIEIPSTLDLSKMPHNKPTHWPFRAFHHFYFRSLLTHWHTMFYPLTST
jgi:hypothetical protein